MLNLICNEGGEGYTAKLQLQLVLTKRKKRGQAAATVAAALLLPPLLLLLP